MLWPFIKKYGRERVRVKAGYAIRKIVIDQSPIEQSPIISIHKAYIIGKRRPKSRSLKQEIWL